MKPHHSFFLPARSFFPIPPLASSLNATTTYPTNTRLAARTADIAEGVVEPAGRRGGGFLNKGNEGQFPDWIIPIEVTMLEM